MVNRVTIVNYTCDGQGCKEHGEGKVPDTWRYMAMWKPHSKPGVANPHEVRALLCPTCFLMVKAFLDPAIVNKKPDEGAQE